MTSVATLRAPEPAGIRRPTPRRFLMCRPDHFEVSYAINPWMDATAPVDRARAIDQWETLRTAFERHGHRVETIAGEPGLPDMVFAANGGLVIGECALSARFASPERAAEGPAYHRWLSGRGLRRLAGAAETNEGEGDFAPAPDASWRVPDFAVLPRRTARWRSSSESRWFRWNWSIRGSITSIRL